MTIAELKSELAKYPDDAEVLTNDTYSTRAVSKVFKWWYNNDGKIKAIMID